MAKFISRLFGGGGKSSTPAPRPVASVSQSSKNASVQKQRVGKARNKSIFTSVLGINQEAKSNLNLKRLTGG